MAQLFLWGDNRFGQCGQDPLTTGPNVISPSCRPELMHIPTIDVACGLEHTVILSETGDVFTLGNNAEGQLGVPTDSRKTSFAPLLLPNVVGAKTISAGERHSACLTWNNEIYTWGHGRFGQLGNGKTKASKYPVKVTLKQNDLGSDETWVQVDCGANHTAALTSAGRIFIWGKGDAYQLGITEQAHMEPQFYGATELNENVLEPTVATKLTAPLDPEEVIVKIGLGTHHTTALTSAGRVLCIGVVSWEAARGSPAHFLAGANAKARFIHDSPDQPAVDIAAGAETVIITLKDETILGYGHNRFNSLCNVSTLLGSGNGTARPLNVGMKAGEVIKTAPIKKISSGTCSTMIISGHDQRIYVWGKDYLSNNTKFRELENTVNAEWEQVTNGGWHFAALKGFACDYLQSNMTNLYQRIQTFQTGDVRFVSQLSPPTYSLYAHKSLIRQQCPKLAAMFTPESATHCQVIDVSNLGSLSLFEVVLRYMYTGKVRAEIVSDHYEPLLDIAQRLEIPPLISSLQKRVAQLKIHISMTKAAEIECKFSSIKQEESERKALLKQEVMQVLTARPPSESEAAGASSSMRPSGAVIDEVIEMQEKLLKEAKANASVAGSETILRRAMVQSVLRRTCLTSKVSNASILEAIAKAEHVEAKRQTTKVRNSVEIDFLPKTNTQCAMASPYHIVGSVLKEESCEPEPESKDKGNLAGPSRASGKAGKGADEITAAGTGLCGAGDSADEKVVTETPDALDVLPMDDTMLRDDLQDSDAVSVYSEEAYSTVTSAYSSDCEPDMAFEIPSRVGEIVFLHLPDGSYMKFNAFALAAYSDYFAMRLYGGIAQVPSEVGLKSRTVDGESLYKTFRCLEVEGDSDFWKTVSESMTMKGSILQRLDSGIEKNLEALVLADYYGFEGIMHPLQVLIIWEMKDLAMDDLCPVFDLVCSLPRLQLPELTQSIAASDHASTKKSKSRFSSGKASSSLKDVEKRPPTPPAIRRSLKGMSGPDFEDSPNTTSSSSSDDEVDAPTPSTSQSGGSVNVSVTPARFHITSRNPLQRPKRQNKYKQPTVADTAQSDTPATSATSTSGANGMQPDDDAFLAKSAKHSILIKRTTQREKRQAVTFSDEYSPPEMSLQAAPPLFRYCLYRATVMVHSKRKKVIRAMAEELGHADVFMWMVRYAFSFTSRQWNDLVHLDSYVKSFASAEHHNLKARDQNARWSDDSSTSEGEEGFVGCVGTSSSASRHDSQRRKKKTLWRVVKRAISKPFRNR
eukprot:GFYU01002793.1.p1 GENE.GFYU01002793.1~~GFYU01002793.1.p1  ORF type:complete len:1257 (-),score=313.60 GFYU01002793.1:78-3848(-)